MKTKKFFIATLLVVAATSIAVVSCKKETQNVLSNNNPQSVKVFSPPRVDDMNAYLKDFKKKMQTATRDGNETLSLEEAAWHLSSVANYDFANANVNFTDLRYDTLSYQITLTNGEVAIADLGVKYSEISNDIDEYYRQLNLENKHFRFINSAINEDGEVRVSIIVSYGNDYHIWYPSDTIYCDSEFDPNMSYPANGLGMTELERVLNLIESRPTESVNGRIYYTITRQEQPLFINYIDPYGSPNFINSRIYCTQGYFYEDIGAYMCYYLCSYHALGHELMHVGLQYNECIIHWDIDWDIYSTNPKDGEQNHLAPQTAYHILTIYYGSANIPIGDGAFDY